MCLMFSRLLTDLVWLAFGLGSVCIACQNASYKLWLEFVDMTLCIFAIWHVDYYTMKTLLIIRVFFS